VSHSIYIDLACKSCSLGSELLGLPFLLGRTRSGFVLNTSVCTCAFRIFRMIAVEQSAFSLHRHHRLFYVLGVYEPGKAVESGLKFRKRREIAWGARSGVGAGASG